MTAFIVAGMMPNDGSTPHCRQRGHRFTDGLGPPVLYGFLAQNSLPRPRGHLGDAVDSAAYAVLAWRYWVSVPLVGITLALGAYIGGLVLLG
ncbi:MAG: hypothetical protein ABWY27_01075 [Telluria sp.]